MTDPVRVRALLNQARQAMAYHGGQAEQDEAIECLIEAVSCLLPDTKEPEPERSVPLVNDGWTYPLTSTGWGVAGPPVPPEGLRVALLGELLRWDLDRDAEWFEDAANRLIAVVAAPVENAEEPEEHPAVEIASRLNRELLAERTLRTQAIGRLQEARNLCRKRTRRGEIEHAIGRVLDLLLRIDEDQGGDADGQRSNSSVRASSSKQHVASPQGSTDGSGANEQTGDTARAGEREPFPVWRVRVLTLQEIRKAHPAHVLHSRLDSLIGSLRDDADPS